MATMPLGENYYNWSHGKKTLVVTEVWVVSLLHGVGGFFPKGALVTQRLFLWVVALFPEGKAFGVSFCHARAFLWPWDLHKMPLLMK